ncbi:MAG: type II toxin-antitoxin system PrlF family antitoxin [Candidatus Aenigmarchaeota archaeon]|nr:type II toxin-antitoxin system PrlF family antitoxin [Candidatus Aenigmarchaeota archaeon]
MKKFESILTSKGQITIPKPIREHLGLKPGKRVVFMPDEDEVIMMKAGQSLVEGLMKIRKDLERKGKLFTEAEIKRMMKEGKKEWSKVE